MNDGTRITVLLAEDHSIVREGLRKILEAEVDMEIVGEAATGRQAVAMTLALRPPVVIMDIAMPQLNGMEATRQIRQSSPDTKVLILSAHSDEAYVESVRALGAAGYLVKQSSAHMLSRAIREILKSGVFFSPSSATRRNQSLRNTAGRSERKQAPRLSPREAELLQLIAEGEGNKQIADKLDISIKTVEKHRGHLMEKLDIHDTASLTRYAIAAGIIECDVRLTII